MLVSLHNIYLMNEAITLAGQFYSCCRELVGDRACYGAILGEATTETGVQQLLSAQSLAGISAMGLLSKLSYDMALLPEDLSEERRWDAAKIGGLTLFAADIVDDEIDRLEMPVEEKFRYLDDWSQTMLSGDSVPSENQYPRGGNTESIRASFDLARYIHDCLDKYDGVGKMADVLGPLAQYAKEQIVAVDSEEQLGLVVKVGAGCGAIGARAVEIVEQSDFPMVMRAAVALGAYAECINHAFEISDDVAEGSPGYATVYLGQYGDTPRNRKLVKARLRTTADDAIIYGYEGLNLRQRRIQRVGKGLIDLKYKALGSVAKPKKTTLKGGVI